MTDEGRKKMEIGRKGKKLVWKKDGIREGREGRLCGVDGWMMW